MDRLKDIIREVHRRSLWQVLGIYLAGSWVAFEVVSTLTTSLALPSWIPGLALILLVVGLPVVVATAFVQEGLPAADPEADRASDSTAEPDREEEDSSDGTRPGSAPSRSVLTWRRALFGGLAAFAVLAAVSGGAMLFRDGGGSTMPPEARAGEAAPAIAVLPFTVRGEELDVLGEGMVDVLSHALDGAAGFRAISSRTVLARWREHAPVAGGEVDLETHLRVARAARARYAVVGSAVRLGGEVRLVGNVYDVALGEQIGSPSVEGDAEDLPSVTDRLAVKILKSLVTGDPSFPGVDVGRVLTESPAALRAYLDGERHMRRFEQEESVTAFRRALEVDSTFALAHWRLVEVHSWGETFDPVRQGEHLEAAHRLRDRLTERDALLVEALAAPARQEARMLKSTVRRFPDDATAWYQLGESLIHSPELTPTGAEIERAFERAIELDPQRPAFYPHAIYMAMIFRGDSSRAAELADQFAEVSRRNGPYLLDLDPRAGPLAVRLGFGGSSEESVLDTLPPALGGAAAAWLRDPRHWTVAARLFQQLVDRGAPGQPRTWARRWLAHYRLLYDGRVADALALMQDEPPLEPGVEVLRGSSWPTLFYRAHVAGLPVPDSVLDRLLFGVLDDPDASTREALYAGAWAIESERSSEADRARSILSEHATRLDEQARVEGARLARDRLRLLDARAALLEGRSTEAFTVFEEAAEGSWVVQWWWGEAALEAGRFEKAARVLGTFGWPLTDNAFVRDPPVQYMMGRALESLGRREEAARAYAAFAEHWAEAAPEVKPRVEDARLRARELSDGGQAEGGD